MAAHDPVACDFGFDRSNSPNVSYNNLLLFPYNSLQFFCCQINRIKSELGLCMSFIVFIHDGSIWILFQLYFLIMLYEKLDI